MNSLNIQTIYTCPHESRRLHFKSHFKSVLIECIKSNLFQLCVHLPELYIQFLIGEKCYNHM